VSDPEDLPKEEMSLHACWQEFWAWTATVPESFHNHWYHRTALRLKLSAAPSGTSGARTSRDLPEKIPSATPRFHWPRLLLEAGYRVQFDFLIFAKILLYFLFDCYTFYFHK